ncbi:DUF397 domain-containing protein [Streptomyces sp. NPDC048045]|uniref:DUF397 domain-containing protein n=1 Tax=Streptomyces sp. NPDC048045 TaxID=3154710 RepID=UPI0034419A8D
MHPPTRNGLPARRPDARGCTGPWSDDAGGACVGVEEPAGGRTAVRRSADSRGSAAVSTSRESSGFLSGAKEGGADLLL